MRSTLLGSYWVKASRLVGTRARWGNRGQICNQGPGGATPQGGRGEGWGYPYPRGAHRHPENFPGVGQSGCSLYSGALTLHPRGQNVGEDYRQELPIRSLLLLGPELPEPIQI